MDAELHQDVNTKRMCVASSSQDSRSDKDRRGLFAYTADKNADGNYTKDGLADRPALPQSVRACATTPCLLTGPKTLVPRRPSCRPHGVDTLGHSEVSLLLAARCAGRIWQRFLFGRSHFGSSCHVGSNVEQCVSQDHGRSVFLFGTGPHTFVESSCCRTKSSRRVRILDTALAVEGAPARALLMLTPTLHWTDPQELLTIHGSAQRLLQRAGFPWALISLFFQSEAQYPARNREYNSGQNN